MGKHCREIKELRDGFEENKTALRQIIAALKKHHGIEIVYKK
jgi:hypothetical protein